MRTCWTKPLTRGEGLTDGTLWGAEQRIGVELPAALREAYLLFGLRADLTAEQDRLVPAWELALDHSDAAVVFRDECQHVAEWGVAGADLGSADPPVYVRHVGVGDWQPFLNRVSVACVEMVLSEVLAGRRQRGAVCLDLPGELIAVVESAYQQMALPEYRAWYNSDLTMRWFSAPGKLLCMHGRKPRCVLMAGGQTLADLRSMKATVPGPWISVEWA